jgi:drug/metabolite transporter (DMT)-like permease
MVSAIPGQLWVLLLLMGVALSATSVAVQYGVTHLSANRAVVLFLFELVAAAISSYFLANETMEAREWVGAVFIIFASFLSGKLYSDRRVG